MKSIRAKLNSSMLIMLVSTLGFGFFAYKKNNSLERIRLAVSGSLSLREKVQDLDIERHDSDSVLELKKVKATLKEDDRRTSISNLIQAYNSNNPKLFAKRVKEFEKLERKYFKISQWRIQKIKKTVHFYLLIAILTPLLGLCGLLYYFNHGVLTPLQHLSHRMMEFLIDQYTFRFSTPPNNEIGNLERTFNSLAQKVLNNMDELHALDRAKSEFVSIASHELRTPLTSIKGSLGLLSNDIVGTLDVESKEMVLVAEQETDRLVRLINDMLDLAKIESRSLTLKKDWLILNELLKKTALGLKGFATAADVNIVVQCHDDSCEVEIDSDRIQQVLTNLISNAIKYSPDKGIVRIVSVLNQQGLVEICVTDQGPGISADNQNLIFEKFRQATDSSNHLVKGTGLGLAISKALIAEHNGDIGVRSKDGEGSTFFFTLPQWRQHDKLNPAQDIKAA